VSKLREMANDSKALELWRGVRRANKLRLAREIEEVNLHAATLNPKPQTPNPKPQTARGKQACRSRLWQTLARRPKTFALADSNLVRTPQLSTPNPQLPIPSILTPQPSTLTHHPSTRTTIYATRNLQPQVTGAVLDPNMLFDVQVRLALSAALAFGCMVDGLYFRV